MGTSGCQPLTFRDYMTSDDSSSVYHRIPMASNLDYQGMILEIRDAVNELRSEQKHIRRDVSELKQDRRNVVVGILTFVGLTVGGAVIWAIKSGA